MDTNEADKTMQELAVALARIYDAQGYEISLTYVFNRYEIPTLRASERIRVVIVREHDEPQHPLYETPLFAGVPVMG